MIGSEKTLADMSSVKEEERAVSIRDEMGTVGCVREDRLHTICPPRGHLIRNQIHIFIEERDPDIKIEGIVDPCSSSLGLVVGRVGGIPDRIGQ